MPDTKIAFQKQMCVKARCETARCGEAARSGTTSTNCAEVRGGTDRGRGGGEEKRKADPPPQTPPPVPRPPAHTARLLPAPRRAPRKAPLARGPAPSPSPCLVRLSFFFFLFLLLLQLAARAERPRFFRSGSLPTNKPKRHVWSLK